MRSLLSSKNKGETERADADALLQKADSFRDSGLFAEAAEAYGDYLKVRPGSFAIWVQRGNCLKDEGDYSEARQAYEQAIKIKADDADVHLQLGHLMKLQGRKADAVRSYKRAFALDPESEEVAIELRALGVKSAAQGSPLEREPLKSKPAIILDITDLLSFLNIHSRVTGIQRVQSCIVNEVINSLDRDDVVLGYCDQNNQTIYALSTSGVQDLLDAVRSFHASAETVRKALTRVHSAKVEMVPRRNDVYIILGAFWIGSDYGGTLLGLKNNGVILGLYIYDLIPLTHPQFVTESTRQDVIDKFADVMLLVDFILTISKYVAQEVAAVMKSEFKRALPIYPVPLAHELPETDLTEDELDKDFVESIPKEFVLSVCTLEGRKNHMLLLSAWTAMDRKHAGRVPHLLLVGKWGWRIEEFRSALEARRYVGGKISILGNLSDPELKYLYEHCLFTVFPSFVEGWGLPVGESLAHGKPCIASNTSSIPEVGGPLVRYIDPHDPIGATDVIEQAIYDREGLKAWTDKIKAEFKVRTWRMVAEDFMAKTDLCVAEARKQKAVPPVTLEAGRLYVINRHEIYGQKAASWADRSLRLVSASGWRPLEDWGCWALRRVAKVGFGTHLPPGRKVRTLLSLRLPPPLDDGLLIIRDWKGATMQVSFNDLLPRWVSVETETDKTGSVNLEFERSGLVAHLDPNRPLYFGLDSIAYHPSDDLNARLNLLESMLFGRFVRPA